MNRFEFSGKLRITLLIGIGIGLLSMILTYFIGDDDLNSRFWSNFLHNSSFFTGISLMAVFFIAASVTAWAGWYVVFKRLWESFSIFLFAGLILMTILGIGNYFQWHFLYHWADDGSVAHDAVLKGKSAFLNKNWYLVGGLLIMGIWIFFRQKMRRLSIMEEKQIMGDYSIHQKLRIYSAVFLPIAGFSSAAMIWLWLMSLDAHWYSTLYAWYTASSWFVALVAMVIITLLFLKKLGYYEQVTDEHIHDLGKFLFAFSVFWAYLWFSQFMLIWYANVGEETVYFKIRKDEYSWLFYGNVVINFVVPFFALIANSFKRHKLWLVIISAVVFVGHWLDFFLMIKPGVLHTAHELIGHGIENEEVLMHHHHLPAGFGFPGLFEVGTFIGFLSLFLFLVFSSLGKAGLVSQADPYIEESLHHHV
ncbi:MAG TPA: hypothetical protein DCQ58_00915 [Saprospirales bacterium]|nr:hypothetical protein [Saprospirales bacterium]